MLTSVKRPAAFVSYLLKDHGKFNEYWSKVHGDNLTEGLWFIIILRWADGVTRAHYSSYRDIAVDTALKQKERGIQARVLQCQDSLSRDRLLWEYNDSRDWDDEPYPLWQAAYKELPLAKVKGTDC